mgnify:CR=1 FL=1
MSISCLNITYEYLKYRPCYKKSYYEKSISNSFVESYINLSETPILVGLSLIHISEPTRPY